FDLLAGQAGLGHDLFLGRDPAEALFEIFDDLLERPAPIGGVGRHVDGRAGPLDPSLEGLPDPPGGVGGELVALRPVELLDRPDEPDRALLDEVQEVHPRALVTLGPVDNETQVGLDHFPLGRLVTLGDPYPDSEAWRYWPNRGEADRSSADGCNITPLPVVPPRRRQIAKNRPGPVTRTPRPPSGWPGVPPPDRRRSRWQPTG